MTVNSSRMPRRAIISLIVVTLLGVSIGLGYFFSIRTPDSTYQTVESHIKSLEKSAETINNRLEGISFAKLIDSDLVNDIDSAARNYNENLTSLATTIETSKDKKLKSTFDQHRPALTNFGTQANNTSVAIGKYWNILDSCAGIDEELTNITTVASFNTTATLCINSINEAKLAPTSDFTNQFLSTYQGYSAELIAAYKQRVETRGGKASLNLIETTKTKMQDLAKIGLDLSPGGTPNGLNEITVVTLSQKSKFLR